AAVAAEHLDGALDVDELGRSAGVGGLNVSRSAAGSGVASINHEVAGADHDALGFLVGGAAVQAIGENKSVGGVAGAAKHLQAAGGDGDGLAVGDFAGLDDRGGVAGLIAALDGEARSGGDELIAVAFDVAGLVGAGAVVAAVDG